ncbi:MAG: hypothetical protein R3B84_16470 [Zavarzinella sp.]
MKNVVLFSCFIFLLSGCSSSEYKTVHGTVTLKGVKLDQGYVRFIAQFEGGTEAGAPITNGEYSVPESAGMKPGIYKVILTSGEPGTVADQAPGDSSQVVNKDRFPAEWNTQSQKTIEVTAGGPNKFDFAAP